MGGLSPWENGGHFVLDEVLSNMVFQAGNAYRPNFFNEDLSECGVSVL